jgi:hypothetical protein
MISEEELHYELNTAIKDCQPYVKEITREENSNRFSCKINIILLENVELHLLFHSGHGWKVIHTDGDADRMKVDNASYFPTLHSLLIDRSKLYLKSFHDALSNKLLQSTVMNK